MSQAVMSILTLIATLAAGNGQVAQITQSRPAVLGETITAPAPDQQPAPPANIQPAPNQNNLPPQQFNPGQPSNNQTGQPNQGQQPMNNNGQFQPMQPNGNGQFIPNNNGQYIQTNNPNNSQMTQPNNQNGQPNQVQQPTNNQYQQNNQPNNNGQMMNNDKGNWQGNFSCSQNDASADVRDANRIISQTATLAKKKNLDSSLIEKLNNLNKVAADFVSQAKSANDADLCDILTAWRSGDNTEDGNNPLQTMGELNTLVNFPTEISRMQKDLTSLTKALAGTRYKKVDAAVLSKAKDDLNQIQSSLTQAQADFKNQDLDSVNDDLQTVRDQGDPGTVKCALEAMLTMTKIDSLKIDQSVKDAMTQARSSVIASAQNGNWSDACQAQQSLQPFLNTVLQTKASNLTQVIQAQYCQGNAKPAAPVQK